MNCEKTEHFEPKTTADQKKKKKDLFPDSAYIILDVVAEMAIDTTPSFFSLSLSLSLSKITLNGMTASFISATRSRLIGPMTLLSTLLETSFDSILLRCLCAEKYKNSSNRKIDALGVCQEIKRSARYIIRRSRNVRIECLSRTIAPRQQQKPKKTRSCCVT